MLSFLQFISEAKQQDLHNLTMPARNIEATKKHERSFQQHHRDAINAYRGDTQGDLNNALRSKDPARLEKRWGLIGPRRDRMNPPKYKDKVKSLDHVTSKKMPEAFHVYRGYLNNHPIAHLKPGSTFTDDGYSSTSLDMRTAMRHSGKDDKTHVIAKIHVPKGTRGHYLHDPNHTYSGEQEVILHRGTTFRVQKHTTAKHPNGTDVHVVHMRVHGQREPKAVG